MDNNVFAKMDILKMLFSSASSVIKIVKHVFKVQLSVYHVLVIELLTLEFVFVKMGITQIQIIIVRYVQLNVCYANNQQLIA